MVSRFFWALFGWRVYDRTFHKDGLVLCLRLWERPPRPPEYLNIAFNVHEAVTLLRQGGWVETKFWENL